MKKIILGVLLALFIINWRTQPSKPTPKRPLIKPIVKAKTKVATPSKTTPPIKKTTDDHACKEKTICKQMDSCQEAVFYLHHCGLKTLDRDKDGIPCEGQKCSSYRGKK